MLHTKEIISRNRQNYGNFLENYLDSIDFDRPVLFYPNGDMKPADRAGGCAESISGSKYGEHAIV
jgi:hypothetical protein